MGKSRDMFLETSYRPCVADSLSGSRFTWSSAVIEFSAPTRRHILVQPSRQEARHRLARRLFHGDRGQLRQGYREEQEDRGADDSRP
jgi:hypothetical protein